MDINTKQSKIKKTSKIIFAFLRIGMVLTIIGTTACIIIGIILAIGSGGDIVGNMPGLSIQERANELGLIKCISSAISLFIITIILYSASRIFKDMSNDYTPFSSVHSSRLKFIAVLMLALSILPPLIPVVFSMVFKQSQVVTFSIDFAIFIFAAIFYCLAQIFEYGRIFQEQSDETL